MKFTFFYLFERERERERGVAKHNHVKPSTRTKLKTRYKIDNNVDGLCSHKSNGKPSQDTFSKKQQTFPKVKTFFSTKYKVLILQDLTPTTPSRPKRLETHKKKKNKQSTKQLASRSQTTNT